MKNFLKHVLTVVLFVCGLILLLIPVSMLVNPKDNTVDAGMRDISANGILAEPEQLVDVLIIGDSESYSSFVPLQIYDEYGYTVSYARYEPVLREVESAATNAAPQAPANGRAVATTEGILIEWNDAADDHTPANKMRYNLSVKHAGQSGAGAYVISPQNGGNAQAAYLPSYQYMEANHILVSKDVLTAGD